MPTNTSTAPALILDFRAEGLITLCEKWEREMLTVPEFNQAMIEFAADARSHGCYNKLSGTFAFVDASGQECELEFRIDADENMREGLTLAECFRNRAGYADDPERVEFYNSARAAAALTVEPAKFNKATIKTLRSIRHSTRNADWASMGDFDIVHMNRLAKAELLTLDTEGSAVGAAAGHRWHVQLTPAGHAFLNA